MGSKSRLAITLTFLFIMTAAWAKDYAIFDGRVYNNLFYPRIDVITWNDKKGDPYTMHFNVYYKGKPFDMSFKVDDTGQSKVLLVRYHLKERNEFQCRRIPAPFNIGPNFKVYKDTTDKDMDKTIISMEEMPKKDGRVLITPPAYEPCEEPKEEETNALGRDPNDPASYKVPEAQKGEAPKVTPTPTEQEKLNKQYNFFN